MSFLDKIERMLTVAIEWAPNKVFKSSLQPAEILTKLTRALQDHTQVLNGRERAPNHFEVKLNPADFDTFAEYSNNLATDLENSLTDIATSNGFMVNFPIRVTLVQDKAIPKKAPAVKAYFRDHPGGAAPEPVSRRREDPGATRSFEVASPAARFRLTGISEGTRGIVFDVPPGTSTVGRQEDRTLVIRAGVVSRVHARLEQRGNTLRVFDSGSTHGTRVNNTAISQMDLHDGDRVSFATETFRVSQIRNDGRH